MIPKIIPAILAMMPCTAAVDQDDIENKCISNCKQSMAARRLQTVDEDYEYYRQCLAEACKIGEPREPDEKTCVFLCHANTVQQGFEDPKDYEAYLNTCYMVRCGVKLSPKTKKKTYRKDVVLPEYVGCFHDSLDGGLPEGDKKRMVYFGDDLNVKECFDKTKDYGYSFARL